MFLKSAGIDGVSWKIVLSRLNNINAKLAVRQAFGVNGAEI